MNVFIVAAVSADGFIARGASELVDWTSKEDKKVFVELTQRAGVMVFGSTTFRTFNRALPGRRNIVYSHDPIDVEGVETTQEAPAELIARLASEGHNELAICGGSAIFDMFMQAGVVDEIYLTVVPTLFGTGVPLLQTPIQQELSLKSQRNLNDDVMLLHYGVTK